MTPQEAAPGNEPSDRVPLRLGIVADSVNQPRWLIAALRNAARGDSGGPGLELAELVLIRPARRRKPHRPSLARSLYDWIDRVRARRALDILADDDVLKALNVDVRLDEVTLDESGALPAEWQGRRDPSSLDLILLVSDALSPVNVAALGTFGTCVFVLSDHCEHGDRADGLREVLAATGVVGVRLELYKGDEKQPAHVVETVTNAHRYSASLTEADAARHAVPLLTRLLRDLRAGLPSSARRVDASLDRRKKIRSAAVAETPLGIAALAFQYASSLVRRRPAIDRWELAWRWDEIDATQPQTSLHAYTAIRPPDGYFWADPFPCRIGDKYYVLFEELRFSERRGYIEAFELGPDGPVGEPRRVLDRPFHVSYPFVFEHEGAWFMLPEMALEGRVELYRAVDPPWEWTLDRVLLLDAQLIDATIANIAGNWWLFACQYNPGLREWNDLVLYHAPSPFGPWTPHQANPVLSDARCARPAGRVFESGGEWYRPAQDCSRTYGGAVTMRRITRLTKADYEEEEVFRIDPRDSDGIGGVHTYNRSGPFTMIDLKRDR